MSSKWVYLFVVLWFVHVLTMSGGAVAVSLRLWNERDEWLAKLLIVLMGVPTAWCLQAILLIFMTTPRNSVKFNWKFSITMFATALIADICMTVFAVGMVKARKRRGL